MSLANRTLTPDDKAKITALLDEASRTLSDIEVLRTGLSETVGAIAEELDIPKKTLNKAIRAYHKNTLVDDKETVSDVEEILTVTGKA